MKSLMSLLLLLPIMAAAETPTSQPAEIRYKNKVRTQAWFDQQYEKFQNQFIRLDNGKWKDIGKELLKVTGDVTKKDEIGSITTLSDDDYTFKIQKIMGSDVLVEKKEYSEKRYKNRFRSVNPSLMSVEGMKDMNYVEFIIEDYGTAHAKVGDIVTGRFVCCKKTDGVLTYREVKPLTKEEFGEVLASRLPLFEYDLKITKHTKKKKQIDGSYAKITETKEKIVKKPVN